MMPPEPRPPAPPISNLIALDAPPVLVAHDQGVVSIIALACPSCGAAHRHDITPDDARLYAGALLATADGIPLGGRMHVVGGG
jgi:hypothetical protein